jgi:hypothetical protein
MKCKDLHVLQSAIWRHSQSWSQRHRCSESQDFWMFPICTRHPLSEDTDNREEKCQSLTVVGRVNLRDEEEDTINTSKLEYGIHERRAEFTLLISAIFRMSPRFQNLMFRCHKYYFENQEKTAIPQVSRSSLQCLSWLHYK